jgi:hypothetical protein
MTRPDPKTSPWAVVMAWIVVTLPLAWGVYQTALKSRPLFDGAAVQPDTRGGSSPPRPASESQPRGSGEAPAPRGLNNNR